MTVGGTNGATTSSGGTDRASGLPDSVVFDMLSNARRRYVLASLQDTDEVTVRELSRDIAAWENEVEPSAVTSTQRKRVYTALHQTHLPRLDEYGVVEYDRDRAEVRATERLDVFRSYLGESGGDDRNWPRYYLGIGLATVALAVGVMAEIPVLRSVEPGVAALVLGAAVLLVAAVHTVDGTDRLPRRRSHGEQSRGRGGTGGEAADD